MAFHPDQFVVLNSLREDVVEASIQELEYQAEVAEWVGADVINIHGGGAFGDKVAALDRFARQLDRLSPRVDPRLTVENDDGIFTPTDPVAAVPSDRASFGLRRSPSPLPSGRTVNRGCHDCSSCDLESRTDVSHFQPG